MFLFSVNKSISIQKLRERNKKMGHSNSKTQEHKNLKWNKIKKEFAVSVNLK